MIIGIVGKAGSGKDTIAKILQYYTIPNSIRPPLDEYMEFFADMYDHLPENLLPGEITTDGNSYNLPNKLENKKFAGKLKKIAAYLLGVDVKQFEFEDFKSKPLPTVWQNETNTITYRKFLQYLGTDACRDNLHKDVWVNALFADYTNDSYWVITDVRFHNECKAIKKHNGIFIFVESDLNLAESINEFHTSEELPTVFKNLGYNYIYIKNDFNGYNNLAEIIRRELSTYDFEKNIFDFS